MKKRFVVLISVMYMIFIMVACDSKTSSDGPEDTLNIGTEAESNQGTEIDSTEITEPTETPAPTATPEPTATPAPTATPETTPPPVPAFSSDWASNDMEKLIPQPPMVIARSYDEEGTWYITNRIKDYRLADEPRFEVTEDVTRVQALAYFDELRNCGFIERSPMYENKTDIEDAVGVFFLTPDEAYTVTIWHKDDYNMTISIKAVSIE